MFVCLCVCVSADPVSDVSVNCHQHHSTTASSPHKHANIPLSRKEEIQEITTNQLETTPQENRKSLYVDFSRSTKSNDLAAYSDNLYKNNIKTSLMSKMKRSDEIPLVAHPRAGPLNIVVNKQMQESLIDLASDERIKSKQLSEDKAMHDTLLGLTEDKLLDEDELRIIVDKSTKEGQANLSVNKVIEEGPLSRTANEPIQANKPQKQAPFKPIVDASSKMSKLNDKGHDMYTGYQHIVNRLTNIRRSRSKTTKFPEHFSRLEKLVNYVDRSTAEDESTTKPWWWSFAVTTPKPTTSQIIKSITESKIPEYYYYIDYKTSFDLSKEIALDDENSHELFDKALSDEHSDVSSVKSDNQDEVRSQKSSFDSTLISDDHATRRFPPSVGFTDASSSRSKSFTGLTEAQKRKLRIIKAQMSIIRKQLAGAQVAKKIATEMEQNAKTSVDAVTNSLNLLGGLDPTLVPILGSAGEIYYNHYQQHHPYYPTGPLQHHPHQQHHQIIKTLQVNSELPPYLPSPPNSHLEVLPESSDEQHVAQYYYGATNPQPDHPATLSLSHRIAQLMKTTTSSSSSSSSLATKPSSSSSSEIITEESNATTLTPDTTASNNKIVEEEEEEEANELVKDEKKKLDNKQVYLEGNEEEIKIRKRKKKKLVKKKNSHVEQQKSDKIKVRRRPTSHYQHNIRTKKRIENKYEFEDNPLAKMRSIYNYGHKNVEAVEMVQDNSDHRPNPRQRSRSHIFPWSTPISISSSLAALPRGFTTQSTLAGNKGIL